MPTGIKCCAPACPSGHAGCLDVVSYHRFPTNENRRKLWLAKLPIKNWLPTANSRLCERHFADSCYKSISTDSNTTRSEKRVDLCKKLLKPDAYPTIWPNCPTYLTEQQPAPRTSRNSTTGLQTMDADEAPRKEEIQTHLITSLSEFDRALDTQRFPSHVSYIKKQSKRIFMYIDYAEDHR